MSYANYSTVQYVIRFHDHPSHQFLFESRNDALACLSSDLTLISDRDGRNLVVFYNSKTHFFYLPSWPNPRDYYPLLFIDIQLDSFSYFNTPVTFSLNIFWRHHNISLSKTALKKLDICEDSIKISSSRSCCKGCLTHPCLEYRPHVCEGSHFTILLIQTRCVKAFQKTFLILFSFVYIGWALYFWYYKWWWNGDAMNTVNTRYGWCALLWLSSLRHPLLNHGYW